MKAECVFLYQANGLLVFKREQKEWRLSEQFSLDDEGLRAFSSWWGQQEPKELTLLLDIPEEDFTREELPHVQGAARKRMVQRKLEQIYRGHLLRLAVRQTRQTHGRRDDAYLISALPRHNTALASWLSLFTELQVPIARMISLPYALQSGLQRLSVDGSEQTDGAVLWVIGQGQRLRQIVCCKGVLHFSRYSSLPLDASVEALAAEIRLSLQFFSGIKGLEWRQPTPVMLLGDACARLDEAALLLQQDAELRVQYWRAETLDAALKQTSLSHYPAWRLALLAANDSKIPAYEYAPITSVVRRFCAWRVLYYFAVLGLLSALLLGGYFLSAIVQLQQANQSLKQQFSDQQQVPIGQAMPYTPKQMAAALQIERDWLASWPQWRTGLEQVSAGLEKHSKVELDALVWWVSYTPISAPSDVRPMTLHPYTQKQIEVWVAQQSKPARLWQQMEIHGHIKTAPGLYRIALQEVQALQKTLSQQGSLVVLVDAPLNTRTDAQIRAQEQEGRLTGAFVLRVFRPIYAQEPL